jgi:hypothetical protein
MFDLFQFGWLFIEICFNARGGGCERVERETTTKGQLNFIVSLDEFQCKKGRYWRQKFCEKSI